MKRFIAVRALCVALLAALTGAGVAAQGHAHQHGALKLDVAVDAGTLSIQMESPLDNLIGFERAPRNDAERRTTEASLSQLRAAQKLFLIDPAAGCKLSSVTLESAALGLGPAKAKADDGHADIDASFEFKCSATAAWVDVALFATYPRMQSIEVQVVTPRGQSKRTLVRPATRLNLRP